MALRKALSLALAGAVALAAWGAGCGGGDDGSGFTPPPGGDVDGSVVGPGKDGGFILGGDASQGQTLDITPKGATLDVNVPGTSTLQFTATVNGAKVPAVWTIDNAGLGTFDANGLFTASGKLGGPTTVYAQSGNLKGQTTLMVKLHITENPGNVPGGDQGGLKGGGNGDAAFKWLYPYDKTVFPRGLLPPELQFAGTAPDEVYVHITCAGLDYQGFYGASSPGRVNLTPALWTTITETATGTEQVQVQVTKKSAGAIAGPITENWTIAQGSLKGTVYYNTYSSPKANNQGAVMRIKPGASTPDVLIGYNGSGGDSGQCTVCHSVSADGSTLVASHADYQSGASWDLTNNATVKHEQGDSKMSFGGVFPDGSLVMTNGALSGWWPPNIPGQEQGPRASTLIDSASGAQISAPGWDGVITYAIAPAFSPDGKHIAFTHYDKDQGHTFAVMDFDVKTHTFSNLRDLATDPGAYLAWPAFTPDGNWVFYHSDNRQDYATWEGAKADIMVAHIPSKTTTRLNQLDGYDAANNLYLPYGDTEAHLNYEPTMLPVAVGGYYWVVFTSRREYGNEITGASQDDQPRKKLWVAAIDIDDPAHPAASAKDISHPAFYLTGQEFDAGNMRGFWALDPCKQNGNSCDTGDECCSGYCRQGSGGDGGSGLVCVVPPSGCANEFEHCNVTADCCGAPIGYLCINNHCAKPAPK